MSLLLFKIIFTIILGTNVVEKDFRISRYPIQCLAAALQSTPPSPPPSPYSGSGSGKPHYTPRNHPPPLISEIIHTETLTSLEKFVCQVYGDKKCDSVNELRHKKLVSKERKKRKSPSSSKHQAHEKNLTDFYKKMKKSNPAALPPCYASFEQQAFRSNLVANMWRQAPSSRMTMWDKTKHGYKVINGKCSALV